MRIIDFISPKPCLYILKNERFNTKIGIFSSIISIAIISTTTIYLIISLLSRENVYVRQNSISNSPGNIGLNNTILLIDILDKNGNNFNESERIYNMIFHYDIYSHSDENSKNENKNIFKKRLQKCDNMILNKEFSNIPDIKKFYCLEIDSNFTLFNTFGDLKNGFGYLNIYINRCMNNTNQNNTNCLPSELINSYLDKTFLTISFIYYNIDHNKHGNPTEETLKSIVLDFSITVFQRIYLNFKKVTYETDNGFLFHSIETLNFTNLNFKKAYGDFRKNGLYPETISAIIISLDEVTEKYFRSYSKVQNLFGNLSGIMNSTIFIFSYLVKLFTNKVNFINLHNLINSSDEILSNKHNNSSQSIIPVNLIKINNKHNNCNLYKNKQANSEID